MRVRRQLQAVRGRLPADRGTIALGVGYWLVGLWLLVEPELITHCEGDTCWYYSVLTYDIGLFLAGLVATTIASAALAPVSVVVGRTAGTGLQWYGQRLDQQSVLAASVLTGLLAVTLLVVEPFEQCAYTQFGPSGCASLSLWELNPVAYAGTVVASWFISFVGTVPIIDSLRQ